MGRIPRSLRREFRHASDESDRTHTPSDPMADQVELAMSALEKEEKKRPTPAKAVERTQVGEFPKLQRQYRKYWWMSAAACGAILLITAAFGEMFAVVVVAMFVAIVQLAEHFTYSKKLTKYYKSEIVPQFVEWFCEDGSFLPTSGINQRDFIASNLFNTYPDRYRTEDLIEGRIGRTQFSFAEVHAQEERRVQTKNGTKSTWIDIFRGFFFVADFNKHFHGQTTMVPNFPGAKWLAGRDRVVLENPDLMRRFLVCSTDQTEARYILTPGLMERIMGLWKRYPGELSISFTGSCIMVARRCRRDHYEVNLWRSLRWCVERDTMAIWGLSAIVEELNMNTRIWTKE